MNPRVEKVKCFDGSTLKIAFENNEVKVFDVTLYFHYPVYKDLQDEAFFRKAHVLNGTVVWNEYIDLDPDILYLEGKALVKKN